MSAADVLDRSARAETYPADIRSGSGSVMTAAAQAPAAAPPARGDRLAEVYAAHWPGAVRAIRRQVRGADQHLVEDLAQTVFLRAWPYLDTIRDERALPGWLSTIARRVVADTTGIAATAPAGAA